MVHRLLFMVGLGLLSFMFFQVQEAEAQATSTVIISSDQEYWGMLDSDRVYFAIQLENSGPDVREQDQTVKMFANFVNGGFGFQTGFASNTSGGALPEVKDTENNMLENGVLVPRNQSVRFYMWVDSPNDGSTRTERTIQVFGFDNYGYMTQGPNITKKKDGQNLVVKVKALKEFDVHLEISDKNTEGDIKMFQGEGSTWEFELENLGFYSDRYTLSAEVFRQPNPSKLNGWLFVFNNGTTHELAGGYSTRSPTEHDLIFTIIPPAIALPGYYDLNISVSSTNSPGLVKNYTVEAYIPEPDFVITDVWFSHEYGWVEGPDWNLKAQDIQVIVEVSNLGGHRDTSGHTTTHIDVTVDAENCFIGHYEVDEHYGSHQTVYISVINHGEKQNVSFTFIPNFLSKDQFSEHNISVLIDWANDPTDPEDFAIRESNESNNEQETVFRFVRLPNPATYPRIDDDLITGASTNLTIKGKKIQFVGRPGGDDVTGYRWESDLQGLLAHEKEFSTSSLQVGTHNISFYHENEYGVVLGQGVPLGRGSGVDTGFYPPTAALASQKQDESTWQVQVVKLTPPPQIGFINYLLLDPNGSVVTSGELKDIYGVNSGQGQGIRFQDNDLNGRLSPGDSITLQGGEKGDPTLGNLTSLSGYTFKLLMKGDHVDTIQVTVQPTNKEGGLPGLSLTLLMPLLILVALVRRKG